MAYYSSAGSTFALSASAPASETSSAYDALTYTLVGEATNLASFGAESSLISHSPIADRVVKKLKGSKNNGSMEISYALDLSDQGQVMLKAAAESDNAYSIRIVLQNGTKVYFRGLVMSAKREVGGVDSITSGSSTIEITSNIIEVAP
jgi:hypothetical protein